MHVYVQIVLGLVLIALMGLMVAGVNVVPVDPDTKALFNRIVDAIFIVLNVPLLASVFSKKGGSDENIATTYPVDKP